MGLTLQETSSTYVQINTFEGSWFRPYNSTGMGIALHVIMYYSDVDLTPKSQNGGVNLRVYSATEPYYGFLVRQQVRTLKKSNYNLRLV